MFKQMDLAHDPARSAFKRYEDPTNPILNHNVLGTTGTERAINRMHETIREESARRIAAEKQAKLDAEEKDRKETRAPRHGEIRYWVNNALESAAARELPNHFQAVLSFTNAHKPNAWQSSNSEFAVLPNNSQDFWHGINSCKSEEETRHYIKFVQESLEEMILQSPTLKAEQKDKFINALNVEDSKAALRVFAIILGVILFATIAPICVTLAAERMVLECIATSILCLAFTFGPYLFVEKCLPTMRSFPADKGPVCDLDDFKSWLQNLNNVVNEIDPEAANPESIPLGEYYESSVNDQYAKPSFASV